MAQCRVEYQTTRHVVTKVVALQQSNNRRRSGHGLAKVFLFNNVNTCRAVSGGFPLDCFISVAAAQGMKKWNPFQFVSVTSSQTAPAPFPRKYHSVELEHGLLRKGVSSSSSMACCGRARNYCFTLAQLSTVFVLSCKIGSATGSSGKCTLLEW